MTTLSLLIDRETTLLCQLDAMPPSIEAMKLVNELHRVQLLRLAREQAARVAKYQPGVK